MKIEGESVKNFTFIFVVLLFVGVRERRAKSLMCTMTKKK